MQSDAVQCILQSMDASKNQEHRTKTYATIAKSICDRFKTKHKSKVWQCIVGTPGQLGYNIACSKDSFFNIVADGIEVTLFAPKL